MKPLLCNQQELSTHVVVLCDCIAFLPVNVGCLSCLVFCNFVERCDLPQRNIVQIVRCKIQYRIIPRSDRFLLQLSPGKFARRMSEELGLPPTFMQPIARSISRQLLDSERVLNRWAERTAGPVTESVRRIDIDVRFRSIIYRDHLQWDVNCLSNSAELFARCTVADLALPQVRVKRKQRQA